MRTPGRDALLRPVHNFGDGMRFTTVENVQDENLVTIDEAETFAKLARSGFRSTISQRRPASLSIPSNAF